MAAFTLAQADRGIPEGQILGTLATIPAVHDYHGLPNPTATAIVRAALDRASTIEPPRSWLSADKALFAILPADISRVIEGAELKARIEAAWIDSRAQELKASHAGIPIGVLRNCIAGSDRSCPCRGALRTVAGDERDAEIKARQKQDDIH